MTDFHKIAAVSLTYLAAGFLTVAAGGIIGVILGLPCAYLFRDHDVRALEVPMLIGFAVGLVVYLWFNEQAKPEDDG